MKSPTHQKCTVNVSRLTGKRAFEFFCHKSFYCVI